MEKCKIIYIDTESNRTSNMYRIFSSMDERPNVLTVKNISDAKNTLKIESNCMVCIHHELVKSQNINLNTFKNIQVLVVGENLSEDDVSFYLKRGINWIFIGEDEEKLKEKTSEVLNHVLSSPENSDFADFCKVPISMMVKHMDNSPFDIYLKINKKKIIKLRSKDDDISDVLYNYRKKGVSHIYVNKEVFESFTNNVRKAAKHKLFDPSTISVEEMTYELNDQHQLLKETIKHFGLSKEGLEHAESITKNSIVLIESIPNLFSYFNKFKDECSEEYMNILFTSYVVSLMIDNFDWEIKNAYENSTLAILLSDILLNSEDFAQLKKNSNLPQKLPLNVYNHPKTTADKIEEENPEISKDIINMIRFHHERPLGNGFPYKKKHEEIDLLTSVLIVAQFFVDQVISYNFDFQKRNEIFSSLDNEFSVGKFANISKSLKKHFT